jgi:hypothetical protein
MNQEYIDGVKFGLAFGLRYRQMEYQYSKLTADCEALRNKLISSQVNSMSTEHYEYLCLVEDAVNTPSENVKETLNDIFEQMKSSKADLVKLNSNVLNLKASRAPRRKRKAKEPVSVETLDDDDQDVE